MKRVRVTRDPLYPEGYWTYRGVMTNDQAHAEAARRFELEEKTMDDEARIRMEDQVISDVAEASREELENRVVSLEKNVADHEQALGKMEQRLQTAQEWIKNAYHQLGIWPDPHCDAECTCGKIAVEVALEKKL